MTVANGNNWQADHPAQMDDDGSYRGPNAAAIVCPADTLSTAAQSAVAPLAAFNSAFETVAASETGSNMFGAAAVQTIGALEYLHREVGHDVERIAQAISDSVQHGAQYIDSLTSLSNSPDRSSTPSDSDSSVQALTDISSLLARPPMDFLEGGAPLPALSEALQVNSPRVLPLTDSNVFPASAEIDSTDMNSTSTVSDARNFFSTHVWNSSEDTSSPSEPDSTELLSKPSSDARDSGATDGPPERNGYFSLWVEPTVGIRSSAACNGFFSLSGDPEVASGSGTPGSVGFLSGVPREAPDSFSDSESVSTSKATRSLQFPEDRRSQ